MPARTPPTDPFSALNDEQRAAVLHGRDDGAPPLLIVAGAGSGKTTTLAARVARLVLDGADPQRIMLLSFSRRAAASLQRRVGTLLQQALGLRSTQPGPQLPWSGTFHSVAARLLREQAARIGLNPAFTIADRGDSEDLMGWLRQELGFAQTRQRFPLQRTCIAIHSRVINSQGPLADTLQQHFPWCATWQAQLKQLFGRTPPRSSASACSTTTTWRRAGDAGGYGGRALCPGRCRPAGPCADLGGGLGAGAVRAGPGNL